MRAVIDVGQYVSATIRADGHPAQVLAAWRGGAFDLLTSLPILDDLRQVLAYSHIRKRHQWSEKEIDLFVISLGVAAHLTPGELEVRAVEADSTDNKILACAMEGQADYIVSSDEHLTKLGNYEGIPIVPPKRFLEILRAST